MEFCNLQVVPKELPDPPTHLPYPHPCLQSFSLKIFWVGFISWKSVFSSISITIQACAKDLYNFTFLHIGLLNTGFGMIARRHTIRHGCQMLAQHLEMLAQHLWICIYHIIYTIILCIWAIVHVEKINYFKSQTWC